MRKRTLQVLLLILLVISLVACKKDLKVTFDYGEDVIKVVKVAKDAKVAIPDEPTNETNQFLGWYLGEEIFDFDTPITKSITLIAKWSEIETLKIVFADNDGSEIKVSYIEKGTKIVKPEDPIKSGFIFEYWLLENEEFNFNQEVDNQLVLTAKWRKEVTLSDLNKALNALKDNYQLNIDIFIYNELETSIVFKTEDNKSYYKEGEFVEFYFERETSKSVTVYERNGEYFISYKENDTKSKKFDVFNIIKSSWFVVSGEQFKLETEFYNQFFEIFDLDESITLINATLTLDNENNIDSLVVSFEEDRDYYYLIINVNDIGNVNINLPEVE